MNRTLEILKDIYKPYRLTIKGKTTILETTSGNYVVKEKQGKDLQELFSYLKSRNFLAFPDLIEESRADAHVFEYVDDVVTPKEQKAEDLIILLAALHNKTSYYKEVSEDKFKEIYENIALNIRYLTGEFQTLFSLIHEQVYMSPSQYLLIRNSSKIIAAFDFAKKELDEWYDLVKEKKKERVCLVHNHLELNHYLKGSKECFISWEQSKIDTPVLDLVVFYQKEYFDLDNESLLNKYLEKYPLLEEEKKLFFILISMPPKVDLPSNEFKACSNVRSLLDYVFKTENLIRPYYSVE